MSSQNILTSSHNNEMAEIIEVIPDQQNQQKLTDASQGSNLDMIVSSNTEPQQISDETSPNGSLQFKKSPMALIVPKLPLTKLNPTNKTSDRNLTDKTQFIQSKELHENSQSLNEKSEITDLLLDGNGNDSEDKNEVTEEDLNYQEDLKASLGELMQKNNDELKERCEESKPKSVIIDDVKSDNLCDNENLENQRQRGGGIQKNPTNFDSEVNNQDVLMTQKTPVIDLEDKEQQKISEEKNENSGELQNRCPKSKISERSLKSSGEDLQRETREDYNEDQPDSAVVIKLRENISRIQEINAKNNLNKLAIIKKSGMDQKSPSNSHSSKPQHTPKNHQHIQPFQKPSKPTMVLNKLPLSNRKTDPNKNPPKNQSTSLFQHKESKKVKFLNPSSSKTYSLHNSNSKQTTSKIPKIPKRVIERTSNLFKASLGHENPDSKLAIPHGLLSIETGVDQLRSDVKMQAAQKKENCTIQKMRDDYFKDESYNSLEMSFDEDDIKQAIIDRFNQENYQPGQERYNIDNIYENFDSYKKSKEMEPENQLSNIQNEYIVKKKLENLRKDCGKPNQNPMLRVNIANSAKRQRTDSNLDAENFCQYNKSYEITARQSPVKYDRFCRPKKLSSAEFAGFSIDKKRFYDEIRDLKNQKGLKKSKREEFETRFPDKIKSFKRKTYPNDNPSQNSVHAPNLQNQPTTIESSFNSTIVNNENLVGPDSKLNRSFQNTMKNTSNYDYSKDTCDMTQESSYKTKHNKTMDNGSIGPKAKAPVIKKNLWQTAKDKIVANNILRSNHISQNKTGNPSKIVSSYLAKKNTKFNYSNKTENYTELPFQKFDSLVKYVDGVSVRKGMGYLQQKSSRKELVSNSGVQKIMSQSCSTGKNSEDNKDIFDTSTSTYYHMLAKNKFDEKLQNKHHNGPYYSILEEPRGIYHVYQKELGYGEDKKASIGHFELPINSHALVKNQTEKNKRAEQLKKQFDEKQYRKRSLDKKVSDSYGPISKWSTEGGNDDIIGELNVESVSFVNKADPSFKLTQNGKNQQNLQDKNIDDQYNPGQIEVKADIGNSSYYVGNRPCLSICNKWKVNSGKIGINETKVILGQPVQII